MAACGARLAWRQAVAARASRPAAAAALRTAISTPRAFCASARRPYAGAPPGGGPRPARVKFWPFLALIAAGSGVYALLVQQRVKGEQAATSPRELRASVPLLFRNNVNLGSTAALLRDSAPTRSLLCPRTNTYSLAYLPFLAFTSKSQPQSLP